MKRVYLLLHGRGNQPDGDKSAFFPSLQKYLEWKWYTVLAPHLPYADCWTFEQTMQFLNTLIQAQWDVELNIIWHSSGGYLALHLAKKYKIHKLVLINPTCSLSHFSSKLSGLIHSWFDKDWVENYEWFHDHDANVEEIIQHSDYIQFRFGAKDPYIDYTIRQRYATTFSHAPSISFNVLADRGHMWVDEGVRSIEEIYSYL